MGIDTNLSSTVRLNTKDSGSVSLFADFSNRFNRILGNVPTTAKLFCLWKKAPLVFTRTNVLTGTALATKDMQCTSEFGAAYQAATPLDVAALAHMGMSSSFYFFNTTDGTNAYIFYADFTYDFNYVSTSAAGNYPMACVRKG